MNRVAYDEGRHGKDEKGHAQPYGTLRRVMWKLVNRIDGSTSGGGAASQIGPSNSRLTRHLGKLWALIDISVGLIY